MHQVTMQLLHLLVQVSNMDLHRILQVLDSQVAHTAGHHVAVEGLSKLLLLEETRGQLWVTSPPACWSRLHTPHCRSPGIGWCC